MRKGFLNVVRVLFDNPEGGGGGAVSRPDSITTDEWEGLSQEEREGVLMTGEGEQGEVLVEDEGDELTPEELALIADNAKKDDEPAPVAPDASQFDTPAAVEAPTETSAANEPIPDDQLLTFRAVVKDSELPVSTDVPEELSTKLSALEEKYDDGEIPAKEYQAQRDAINREIMISQLGSRDEARADKIWEKEQAHFLQSRPEYLAKDLRGNAMFGALGEAVKGVSNDPKFANASGMAILVEADKAVRELFGGPKPAVKAPAPTLKPPNARPDVKTLASVPTATGNDTSGDPFAPIDRLTGDAFERALERLTPEQRAEYERRA